MTGTAVCLPALACHSHIGIVTAEDVAIVVMASILVSAESPTRTSGSTGLGSVRDVGAAIYDALKMTRKKSPPSTPERHQPTSPRCSVSRTPPMTPPRSVTPPVSRGSRSGSSPLRAEMIAFIEGLPWPAYWAPHDSKKRKVSGADGFRRTTPRGQSRQGARSSQRSLSASMDEASEQLDGGDGEDNEPLREIEAILSA